MKKDSVKRIEGLFAELPMLMAGPVPPDEVARAEDTTGINWDPDYRWFVETFGGAMLGSLPILGLRRAEVMGKDLFSVVDVTRRFRSEGWPGADTWVVISVDGFGNAIGMTDKGTLELYDHDCGTIVDYAEGFEAFVLRQLDEAGV